MSIFRNKWKERALRYLEKIDSLTETVNRLIKNQTCEYDSDELRSIIAGFLNKVIDEKEINVACTEDSIFINGEDFWLEIEKDTKLMIPIYVDPRVIDACQKQTSFVDLIQRW